jgi:hypothetical protein
MAGVIPSSAAPEAAAREDTAPRPSTDAENIAHVRDRLAKLQHKRRACTEGLSKLKNELRELWKETDLLLKHQSKTITAQTKGL